MRLRPRVVRTLSVARLSYPDMRIRVRTLRMEIYSLYVELSTALLLERRKSK